MICIRKNIRNNKIKWLCWVSRFWVNKRAQYFAWHLKWIWVKTPLNIFWMTYIFFLFLPRTNHIWFIARWLSINYSIEDRKPFFLMNLIMWKIALLQARCTGREKLTIKFTLFKRNKLSRIQTMTSIINYWSTNF